MNVENLKRMADYIRTIHMNEFDMSRYRDSGDTIISTSCNSIGCVIGHCTILDDKENIPYFNFNGIPEIAFADWSTKFTGLSYYSKEWDWCFSSNWSSIDNTIEGAARRIEYLIEHGLPENWNLFELNEDTIKLYM